jgi:hypothetical protein
LNPVISRGQLSVRAGRADNAFQRAAMIHGAHGEDAVCAGYLLKAAYLADTQCVHSPEVIMGHEGAISKGEE